MFIVTSVKLFIAMFSQAKKNTCKKFLIRNLCLK